MSAAARALARLAVLATVLVLATFLLPRALPGDPLAALVTGETDAPIALSPEQRERLAAYYGLDRPPLEQLGRHLAGVARGDLGWSIHFQRPVAELIAERLPWSLLLGATALVVALAAGALAGVWAAWQHGRRRARALTATLVCLGALPEFVVGLALILLLAVWLPLLPARGALAPFSTCAGIGCVPEILAHLALPLATLGLAHLPGPFLVMRAAMLEQRARPYVALARAKGLAEPAIALRHAARAALPALVALASARAGLIVGGVVVVETLFAYPGIGRLAAEAVLARDHPVLQATLLVTGLAVLVANAVGDLALGRLDPRIRTGS